MVNSRTPAQINYLGHVYLLHFFLIVGHGLAILFYCFFAVLRALSRRVTLLGRDIGYLHNE